MRTPPAALLLLPLLAAALPVAAQTPDPAPVTMHATGTFEVNVSPAEGTDPTALLGRFALDKRFHGDLEGTGSGEMLTARTTVEGSAGYVAIERISGTLRGREGTFVLQHSGTMARGEQRLEVTVVPDSATGALEGLAGRMTIIIDGAGHRYELEYTLPADE